MLSMQPQLDFKKHMEQMKTLKKMEADYLTTNIAPVTT
jgi:hypothetical protein